MNKEKESTESKMNLTALKPEDEIPVQSPTVTNEVPKAISAPAVNTLTVTESNEVQGVVDNCLALNVRLDADVTGKVAAVIYKGAVVTIDKVASTDSYYNVTTADGISGFCKKEFIKLK